MLPHQHKLTSPQQFRRTIKGGRRAGSRTVVVHFRNVPTDSSHDTEIDAAGPRFGLVVSKAVGNAVLRHRTSRRLRHVCLSLVDELPVTADIVIRALPASATASSEQLRKDITKALRKVWNT